MRVCVNVYIIVRNYGAIIVNAVHFITPFMAVEPFNQAQIEINADLYHV